VWDHGHVGWVGGDVTKQTVDADAKFLLQPFQLYVWEYLMLKKQQRAS
jgi:hypothetical protein